MRRATRLGAAAALALMGCLAAGAAARGGPAAACHVAVTPIRFGAYNPLSPFPDRADGYLVYNCSAPVRITIALGLGHGGSPDPRLMVGGRSTRGSALDYGLYLDPAGTLLWGDGSGGTQPYRALVARPNVNVAVPIFARLPGHQLGAPVGAYADSLLVTITY